MLYRMRHENINLQGNPLMRTNARNRKEKTWKKRLSDQRQENDQSSDLLSGLRHSASHRTACRMNILTCEGKTSRNSFLEELGSGRYKKDTRSLQICQTEKEHMWIWIRTGSGWIFQKSQHRKYQWPLLDQKRLFRMNFVGSSNLILENSFLRAEK